MQKVLPSIQNGKYQRKNFYFQLDPFTIDSLDNFSNEGLTFKGKMETAGIFPTFKEKEICKRAVIVIDVNELDYEDDLFNMPIENFAIKINNWTL